MKNKKKLPVIPPQHQEDFENTKFRTLTLYRTTKDWEHDAVARISCASIILNQTDDNLTFRVAFSFCSPKEKSFWKKFGHRIAFFRLMAGCTTDITINKKAKSLSKALYEVVADKVGQKVINAPNWLSKFAITEDSFEDLAEIENHN